jgi:hypothetical protein
LAASCENYDKGNEWEASRLATTVFTMVHDGGSIVSLLTQLKLRGSLRFVSSGRVPKKPESMFVSATPPLVNIRMGSAGTKFIPKLDQGSAALIDLQFHEWWADEIIFQDDHRPFDLTRRRLVFSLRHQDGGGHIGDLTDPAYVRLKEGAGWRGGLVRNPADPAEPIPLAVAASMRQVAWEVTKTLGQLGAVS